VPHHIPDRQSDIAHNIIPLKNKRKKSPHRNPPPMADAFLVKTDKIFFLAVVYMDKNFRYHSYGYVIFEDGDPLCFTTGAGGDANTREKCLEIGQRIARIYGGTLQQGRIDEHGRFCQHEARKTQTEL
jgi:hypothetical protein